jgi:Cyclic nucleotide-binding domain
MAFRKKKQDPFNEIQVCLQKRDYKGALDWFNTLLQKDAKNTQIRLRFADTLVLSGNKREAVKQFRIVADELAEKGFMIRAIAINKKILQLDPSQTDVHNKLAQMSESRTGEASTRPALEELLHRPSDPLRRSSPPLSAPAPAPTPAAAAPPSTRSAPSPPPSAPESLPELSLEESMAMEFGSSGELPVDESSEEPAAVAIDSADSADSVYTGGFELVDEEEETEAPGAPRPKAIEVPASGLGDEAPSFAEEPFDLSETTAPAGEDEIEIVTIDAEESESEPAIELSLDGVEAPLDESAEIVLEAESEPVSSSLSPEPDVETAETEVDEEADAEPEMEIIAFDGESEPELAADGVESLIGALGEDIDSLIDSIIDDVGSSAKGAEPTREPPPTHIPLFSDLTTQEFIAVAILLVRRVAKVGEVIVREGDPGDSMFIVSTGEVRATVLRDGQQLPVATMRDGDFFGEMAVLSGEPRTATVTAVKATELLELNRENLREVCSRHPHVEAKIRLAYDERIARSAARQS